MAWAAATLLEGEGVLVCLFSGSSWEGLGDQGVGGNVNGEGEGGCGLGGDGRRMVDGKGEEEEDTKKRIKPHTQHSHPTPQEAQHVHAVTESVQSPRRPEARARPQTLHARPGQVLHFHL